MDVRDGFKANVFADWVAKLILDICYKDLSPMSNKKSCSGLTDATCIINATLPANLQGESDKETKIY